MWRGVVEEYFQKKPLLQESTLACEALRSLHLRKNNKKVGA
jgi:hypothetical protein